MKIPLIFKIILTMILVFILMCWLLFKFQDSYFKDYLDTNYEVAYEGEVVDIQRNRGFIYVELNNGEKYNIIWASNDCYSPKKIWNFLEVGDLLNKPVNTDSLFIIKKDKEYLFVLGKDIKCK